MSTNTTSKARGLASGVRVEIMEEEEGLCIDRDEMR